MARWSFVSDPNLVVTGSWESTVGTSLPDFTAFPGFPYARMAVRITGVGVRPLYDGPIGRLVVSTREQGVNVLTHLQGTEMTVMSDQWYSSASQAGGIGDYIWAVPQVDWPLLGFSFWSNGRASGGEWELRLFNV